MHTYSFDHFSVEYGRDSNLFSLFLSETEIKPHFENGPWIAGGSVRRFISGENQDSDIDVFFHDKEQLDIAIGSLLNKGYLNRFATEHSSFYYNEKAKGFKKVNLVFIEFYETAEKLIESFDFTICQAVTDFAKIGVGQYTLFDIARKRLHLNKVTYPLSTFKRILKYEKQGYKACDGFLSLFIRTIRSIPSDKLDLNIKYFD